ncbi:MAG: AMP-binding protein [Thermodesulfobacteriota bacterium]|nr:AMP-binding protein [Thermodesulfobacteriota bacterium]
MARWLNLGETLKINAKKYPRRIAFCDSCRSFTYPESNIRVNKLANSLFSMGLVKGDRIAVFMENSIEMAEIFLAVAKTGMVIVPINFRLVADEIEYIVNNSKASAMIVDKEFVPEVEKVRGQFVTIAPDRYIVNGEASQGWISYDSFTADSDAAEPVSDVKPEDIWIHIYTSGTTGKPKGVLRSHESHIAFYLINAIDFGFNENDTCMNVMPLCHINSTYYTFTFTYLGGTAYIHPARSFKPSEILEIIEKNKITFISLIPTHYNLILNLDRKERNHDVSSIRKLLCSSAPVRKEMKKAIMDFFQGVELYEAYGSTEAGIVTILKPEDQMRKLGSIGYEVVGTDFIKLLNEDGNQVKTGEVGELYSRSPMLFDEYFDLPEKTADSFAGEWFSAGDMAVKDEDGFYSIVDRKDNMIITGGENVYPSEIEDVVASHADVFDCACIGVPDEKWGEKIVVVVVPKPGRDKKEIDGEDIRNFCRTRLAGYKIPKKVVVIDSDDMPRTPTGKILHRKLRARNL